MFVSGTCTLNVETMSVLVKLVQNLVANDKNFFKGGCLVYNFDYVAVLNRKQQMCSC